MRAFSQYRKRIPWVDTVMLRGRKGKKDRKGEEDGVLVILPDHLSFCILSLCTRVGEVHGW